MLRVLRPHAVPSRTTLVLVLLATGTAPVFGSQAQATAGIRGRVVDQTGGALPGATVTATNTATGVVREAATDASGYYSITALPVTGEYRVRVALSGFSSQQVDHLDLRAGETATVNATLLVGASSEVTVYGTAEGVRTDEPQLGATLDTEQIDATPMIGRKLTNLPLLDSAVRPAVNTGDLFLNNTLFVVDGSGRRQTTFTLDGSSADDAWGRQTVFTNVPLSAIQEFTVLSQAFSAEYGRTTGAAVNIVTKSGTNDVRADLLYTWRPSAGEGGDPVAMTKAPDVLNQVSASVGGPIVRDRTHYFVSGEYSHQTGRSNQELLDGRIDHVVEAGHTLTFKVSLDALRDDNPQGVVGGLTLPSAGRVFTRRAYGAQASDTAVLGPTLLNSAHVQAFYGAPITEFNPLQPSTQYVYPGFATIGESRFATLFSHQVEAAVRLTAAETDPNRSRGLTGVTICAWARRRPTPPRAATVRSLAARTCWVSSRSSQA